MVLMTAARPAIADKSYPVWVGVDASVKHDLTAIAAVTFDRKQQKVRLVTHRVFQPSPDAPLDFENTIESTLIGLHKCFRVKKVCYDPFQMASSAQRLIKERVKMEETPQTVPTLTAAAQNLYDLVHSGNFTAYHSEEIRLAMSRAVAIESTRGWRIAKDNRRTRSTL